MNKIIARDILKNSKALDENKPLSWHEPTKDFTDNQWYFYQARHTVYFTAFSNDNITIKTLENIAKNLVELAPQLLAGFDNNDNGKNFPTEILQQICSIKTVESLKDYPDKWNIEGSEVFSSANLPLFRIKCVVKKNSSDGEHKAMILILSTHALIEGADVSLLTSSKKTIVNDDRAKNTAFLTKAYYKFIALFIAPLQVLAAAILVPKTHDKAFKTLVVEHTKLRSIARSLGVSRRALMFALVAYGLNNGGKGFSKRVVSIVYADMDRVRDYKVNSDFFKFHAMTVKFKVKQNFVEFVQGAEKALKKVEFKNPSSSQDFFDAIFSVHRFMKKYIPFIYSEKTFRFNAGFDLNLSLTSPQRLNGDFTKLFVEPVYCGAFNPGLNVCVFIPGRTKTSFNFAMSKHHLKNVAKIESLLEQLDLNTK